MFKILKNYITTNVRIANEVLDQREAENLPVNKTIRNLAITISFILYPIVKLVGVKNTRKITARLSVQK